uniref:Uncharacterized protein n=1 Tax=Cucumis melo TaxID=3656 RepID=A0A9I9EGS1_CUCME
MNYLDFIDAGVYKFTNSLKSKSNSNLLKNLSNIRYSDKDKTQNPNISLWQLYLNCPIFQAPTDQCHNS